MDCTQTGTCIYTEMNSAWTEFSYLPGNLSTASPELVLELQSIPEEIGGHQVIYYYCTANRTDQIIWYQKPCNLVELSSVGCSVNGLWHHWVL